MRTKLIRLISTFLSTTILAMLIQVPISVSADTFEDWFDVAINIDGTYINGFSNVYVARYSEDQPTLNVTVTISNTYSSDDICNLTGKSKAELAGYLLNTWASEQNGIVFDPDLAYVSIIDNGKFYYTMDDNYYSDYYGDTVTRMYWTPSNGIGSLQAGDSFSFTISAYNSVKFKTNVKVFGHTYSIFAPYAYPNEPVMTPPPMPTTTSVITNPPAPTAPSLNTTIYNTTKPPVPQTTTTAFAKKPAPNAYPTPNTTNKGTATLHTSSTATTTTVSEEVAATTTTVESTTITTTKKTSTISSNEENEQTTTTTVVINNTKEQIPEKKNINIPGIVLNIISIIAAGVIGYTIKFRKK